MYMSLILQQINDAHPQTRNFIPAKNPRTECACVTHLQFRSNEVTVKKSGVYQMPGRVKGVVLGAAIPAIHKGWLNDWSEVIW